MKKYLFILLVLVMASCNMHKHIVGNGPQSKYSYGEKAKYEVSKKQWYLAWGLAQINAVDTRKMAGVKDYSIQTELSFVDGLIGTITYGLIYPRTVIVKK